MRGIIGLDSIEFEAQILDVYKTYLRIWAYQHATQPGPESTIAVVLLTPRIVLRSYLNSEPAVSPDDQS